MGHYGRLREGDAVTHGLFGFTGRIGRAAYFGYSLLIWLFVAIAVGIAVALMSSGKVAPPAVFATVIIGIGSVVALVWANFALLIKRLHDLGLAGTNAIWIVLLSVGASATSIHAPLASILFGLASLGVELWLLFAPGQPAPNRFGPAPGSSPTFASGIPA